MTALIEPTALIPGLTVLQADPGTDVRIEVSARGAVELTASATDGLPGLRVEVDLADAVAYWHPGLRGKRALPADWEAATVTSLVQSAPVGALYNTGGQVLLGWAASEAIGELSIRFGVSEERKSFVVDVRPVRPLDADLVVLLDGGRAGLAETVGNLAAWLSARCAGDPLTPRATTRTPVYSTWYTFTQDINDAVVSAEAAIAVELGCGSVFIDDGWQRFGHGRGYQGCGDWLPDQSKFPDLAETVRTIHGDGAAVALWVAPLLLGRESSVFAELEQYASEWVSDLNCSVLDPRFAEVREQVAQMCLRLVRDYGVDLLKIDFLDQAMVYRDSAGGGDLSDVGQAMAAMLALLRQRLADAGFGHVAFEFRQPYVSPALARFGEILRASDCPADSFLNRLATVDARLFSVGQVVHADPMMWGSAGGAAAVAQQLYSGWFAVPQISMRLSELALEQAAALRGLIALWRDQSAVTLDGHLNVQGAERGYDVVSAVRADLGRSVVARYAPVVVEVGATSETTVINATADERLVLRTVRPIIGGVVRSAAAVEIEALAPAGPGLVEIPVPAYGSVTIRT
jgi:alpha-galactosidase